LTADLTLAGEPCNIYGTDIEHLRLEVEYQTGKRVQEPERCIEVLTVHTDARLHVVIYDADENVYQVPESVFPRPATRENGRHDESSPEIRFSFSVSRASNGETLFNSSGHNLVFESQYINVRTSLPESPNLYGLGEHSDPFRLNTTSYTRTLWNRDAYMIPAGTNLYGTHPLYLDHRGETGTHGVFLLNSNGMDIRIDKDANGSQFLEYNILGGVLDFYFLAGPSPMDVSVQYAEVAGLPAMVPYWGFGVCNSVNKLLEYLLTLAVPPMSLWLPGHIRSCSGCL
jgi:alpha-glucosidase